MKTMSGEHTLQLVSQRPPEQGDANVQAYDAKRNECADVEQVGKSECKAEEYAQHSSPAAVSSALAKMPGVADVRRLRGASPAAQSASPEWIACEMASAREQQTAERRRATNH
jgi:hypothetical protein